MIRFGVIGYGYWGPNLARNLAEARGAKVVAVSDLQSERCDLAQRRYPCIWTSTDARDILSASDIDVVVIATPVVTHFELAMAALSAGKHVLLEKPMTQTAEQGLRVIEAAERAKRLLMVDHTFIYTGAVQKLRELIIAGSIGNIYYYDSVRINLGLLQHDVNVLWDLAVHDLSIMDYLFDVEPVAVSANGISHFPGSPENTAYLTMFYDCNRVSHINVNWLAPVKVRRTLIGGSRWMVVYDDLEPSEKIKVYDRGVVVAANSRERVYEMLISHRIGDMWAPKLDTREALAVEVDHLIHCVNTGAQPITDGALGLRVVQQLEAATCSMRDRGQPVELTRVGR
jgi:predicted dehydrogenase